MGTLPTPNPSPNPSRSPSPSPITFQNCGPVPNPAPTQAPAPGPKSPPYEEVSKLFSLPFSDAADSLGVCPSVLKKVCYDNGLVRWPHRNFLAGKSIEEIKKEAAIEKEKKLAGLKVTREGSIASASPAVSTPLAPQPQSTNTNSPQEYPASRMLTQSGSSHTTHSSTMNRGSAPDEFKYGFPLNGLSSTSYRWWGNKSDRENVVDSGAKEMADEKQNETNADPQKESSLSALRKRAAKEGQQAMRLGVYRGYNVKAIDPSKKMVLLQIFKSSLPCEWGDISPES